MSQQPRALLSLLLLLPLLASCGSCQQAVEEVTSGGGDDPANDPSVVFSHEGDITDQSEHIGTALVQRFDVTLETAGTFVVTLSSSAFDPMVHVTTPEGITVSNDDWQGSHEHSQLSLELATPSTIKVAVTSHLGEGTGRYRLLVRRADGGDGSAGEVLTAGNSETGQLESSDPALPDGRHYDTMLVQGPGSLRVSAEGAVLPQVAVVNPGGQPVWQGADGAWPLVVAGVHRVQIMGPSADATARYEVAVAATEGPPTPTLARNHHQLPTVAGAAPVQLNQPLDGALADGDATLPSGELADVYTLSVPQSNTELTVQLDGTGFDPYVMVIGPDGRYWENDDFGGTTNSRLEMTAPVAGAYRVVATAYRDTDRGSYNLAVSRGGARTVNVASIARPVSNGGGGQGSAGSAGGGSRTIQGSLAAGDSQLQSGEFFDEHPISVPTGRTVTFTANSSEFDTYLIVHPPTGRQQDNDDGPNGTNAQVQLVSSGGEYRVKVTSYRPGETGRYELVIDGAGAPSNGAVATPTPAPAAPSANSVRGTLARGDETLQSGEFVDSTAMNFTPGQAVQIRLASSNFDTYLIVRTPSGRQLDNDDFESGSTNSGVDIPSAEAGQYQILITSYQPGETGSYTLTHGAGASAPQQNGGGGGGSGGQVWGLFAGISDYPGNGNDLPECANDATRLAETLHHEGLLDQSRQVVLTDSQATTGNIRSNMQRLATQLGPNDVFVFFYSGHGGQTHSTNDPREIDGTDEYLAVYDGQLLDDELGRLFDALPSRIALVALDACHSGGFAKDIITRPGRVGLFSSEEDVLSAVAGQFQAGGYLSHFLRVSMSGDADMNPRDNVLTVGELTHHVYTQFGAHARDVHLAANYQHLVVDRGAVGVDQILWSYH